MLLASAIFGTREVLRFATRSASRRPPQGIDAVPASKVTCRDPCLSSRWSDVPIHDAVATRLTALADRKALEPLPSAGCAARRSPRTIAEAGSIDDHTF